MTFLSEHPILAGAAVFLAALAVAAHVTLRRAKRKAEAHYRAVFERAARGGVRIRPAGDAGQLAATRPRHGQRAPIPKGRAFRAARQPEGE